MQTGIHRKEAKSAKERENNIQIFLGDSLSSSRLRGEKLWQMIIYAGMRSAAEFMRIPLHEGRTVPSEFLSIPLEQDPILPVA
jgi:hypothetical protein